MLQLFKEQDEKNIRQNVKNSTQAMQTKNCNQDLYLCEESLSKELGNFSFCFLLNYGIVLFIHHNQYLQ